MKFLISLVLSLLLLIPSVGAIDTNREFIAVFCNDTLEKPWYKQNPDLLYLAKSWSNLDDFLLLVREQAKNRPILIDIDCHGEDGGLYIQYDLDKDEFFTERASVGFVLNRIESYIRKDKLTVLFEACYAGRAYKNTLKNNKFITLYGDNYRGDRPSYPVYGIGSSYKNISNFIFLQYKYKVRPYFVDLRRYQLESLGAKDTNKDSKDHTLITYLWRVFYLYGT